MRRKSKLKAWQGDSHVGALFALPRDHDHWLDADSDAEAGTPALGTLPARSDADDDHCSPGGCGRADGVSRSRLVRGRRSVRFRLLASAQDPMWMGIPAVGKVGRMV